jgi:hypothetical protein
VSHDSPINAGVLWSLDLDDRPQLARLLRLETGSACRLARGPLGPVLTAFNERVATPP